MRLLRPADYRPMPWRNGGGTTTELLVVPSESARGRHGAGGLQGARSHQEETRFRLRVSIAEVTRDGPFSRFPGYDRHIAVIEGPGMTLACAGHGAIALRPRVPATFSGDWDVHGTLDGGPVRDFNVMVDRAWGSATLSIRALLGPETIDVAPGGTCILHVLSGDAGAAAAGETVVAEAPFTIAPRGPTEIVIARIRPR